MTIWRRLPLAVSAVAALTVHASAQKTTEGVANAVEWVLMHHLAYVLVERFDLDFEGAFEEEADGYASTQFAARRPDAEAANGLASVAALLATARGGAGPVMPGYEAEERPFRVACIAVGSDGDVAPGLASLLGSDVSAFDGCGRSDRDTQTESWDVHLSTSLLFEGEAPSEFVVELNETDEYAVERELLAELGTLDMVAREAAATYAFIEPLKVSAQECGGEPPEKAAQVVLCYETVRALVSAAENADAADGSPEEGVREDAEADADRPTEGSEAAEPS